MKKILVFVSVVFLLASFTLDKKKEFIPPGTVKINDTLFADVTEISNQSWLEFVTWNKTKYGLNSPQHTAAKQDSSVWKDMGWQDMAHLALYHSSKAYYEFPVVGITYEQAIAYCEWRTQRVKEMMSSSSKYGAIEFNYRLPSKAEWESFSNNGVDVFNGPNYVTKKTKKNGDEVTVIHYKATVAIDDSNYFSGPWLVKSHDPNLFKLYNMIGNVSEMVREKGISKGGSWLQKLEECKVTNDIEYTKPASWLGFRCVAVVKKTK